jgi:hypothetical protein
MGRFTSISAAILTRHGRFSGTSGRPWLIVSQAGTDQLNKVMLSTDTVGSVRRGECIYYYQPLPAEGGGELSDELTGPGDLYVRLATTSSDLWEPELAIVWGTSKKRGTVPLALDLDLRGGLSTNPREGAVSLPVRRVREGDDDTTIHRLLLVIVTYDAPYAGTDDPILLRVTTQAGMAVDHVVTDTPQTDLEIDTSNVYSIPVDEPFRRGELRDAKPTEIRLTILGTDKWVPKKMFLFGLDHPSGAPESVVTLVRSHDPGPLSADPTEGVPSLYLPLQ